jgi:hypothetical protein
VAVLKSALSCLCLPPGGGSCLLSKGRSASD